MYNEAPFNGFAEKEDTLVSRLKVIFDKDDAEHIYQAQKNNMDYFLTLDKKTILNRASSNRDKLTAAKVTIRFVLPAELVKEWNSISVQTGT